MEKSTKEILEYEFVAGVDCGNYETEIAYYNEEGAINYANAPSVMEFSSTKHPELELTEQQFMGNLFDHLHIYFKSSNEHIHSYGYYNIGRAAINSQGLKENMDINSNFKSTNEIPIIMSTTVIAATVLKEHYEKNQELPNELHIKTKISTGIPSSEYTPDRAKLMESRLKGAHLVEFYIGKQAIPITVDVEFAKCTEEGKTAMLAFTTFGDEILEEYNEEYGKQATVDDFTDKETFHLDIGDGTSEFTFIHGLTPVASAGKRMGVGHATTGAILAYNDRMNGFAGNMDRQSFMDLLRGNRGKTALAKECFDLAVKGQANLLLSTAKSNFVTLTNAAAEYIFVHGGGSCVFKESLYRNLVEFGKEVYAEIVYIPCRYATHMNSTGNLVLIKALVKN